MCANDVPAKAGTQFHKPAPSAEAPRGAHPSANTLIRGVFRTREMSFRPIFVQRSSRPPILIAGGVGRRYNPGPQGGFC